MRVLILSFYYAPDLSAGSFRATALVRALRNRSAPGTHIHVITTLPNRYSSYVREAPETEVHDGIEIRRIGLPKHSSDMRGQARAFFRFARHVLRLTGERRYDIVVATSSRLMTATLGAWIARRQRALLYLDIRDIFVETISELMPKPAAKLVEKLFSVVELWTMRRASRINVVSAGFETYFRARYPNAALTCFTNGIDDEFLNMPTQPKPQRTDQRTVVLYAGNIGEGQSLHNIVPGIAAELKHRARFVIIGDGGRRQQLQAAIAGLSNVELRAPLQRSELIAAYQNADVLFLHLGDYEAFQRVLPSKLFEYAALGKPILAGVDGYAARFVREEISNAAVFAPCRIDDAIAALDSLELVDRARPGFIAKYSRESIARAMADDILKLNGAA